MPQCLVAGPSISRRHHFLCGIVTFVRSATAWCRDLRRRLLRHSRFVGTQVDRLGATRSRGCTVRWTQPPRGPMQSLSDNERRVSRLGQRQLCFNLFVLPVTTALHTKELQCCYVRGPVLHLTACPRQVDQPVLASLTAARLCEQRVWHWHVGCSYATCSRTRRCLTCRRAWTRESFSQSRTAASSSSNTPWKRVCCCLVGNLS